MHLTRLPDGSSSNRLKCEITLMLQQPKELNIFLHLCTLVQKEHGGGAKCTWPETRRVYTVKKKTKPLSPRSYIVCLLSPFFHFLVGISSVLFESRIGCLDEVVPEETECFIRCINTMFVMTLLTMAMPKWLHQLFPKPWNIFCRCWDYMFDFGKFKHKTSAKTQCTTLNTTYLT